MSSNSAGNDAGKSRQSLLASRNRYHWVGERKQDKEGPHYNSVYIARRDIPAFILNEQDTVQMDGPDDDRPFVGIVLRLYEANSRKTMDIEWFYLKEEIVQFAPRSHNNIVIEDREVFLAEGEVEIVENFLGSVKNPCYIVYITPQDSLLPQNQRAITHSKFFEVYFCRYSFNEQKNTTTAITPSLAANKYLLKNWHTIPEPIRNYLQKDISLPCFKNVTVNDVKLTLAIPSTTIKMGGNLKNILTVWGNTAAQLDGQQSKISKEGGAANTSVRKKPTTTTTTTTTTAAGTNGSTASVTSNTTAPASTVQSTRTPLKSISCSAAAPLDNKRVLSLDVYDLAQNIMFQDIDFSSSDADSTDSETLRRRRHQQGYIRTKGRSSAVKRQQCGEDKEFVLARWSDLSEQQRKAYFLQARSMKDTALCSTIATNTSSTAATTAANAVKLPTDPPKWKNRSDSVSSAGGRAQQQSSRSKASSAKSGTSPSKLPTAKPSADSASKEVGEKKEGEEDSSGSEDRFSDIDQQEYSGLLDDLSNPYMPDEDLSYRLFCYEHDLYASSSTPSGSSSSEGRRRQPRVKTPAELAQRAKKQADRKYREWTDLSFKKLKTFTKRAQRLRQYHAHVSVQGKAGTGALGEGNNHAAAGAVAVGVGSSEEVDEAILQAVTAGLGKYEIALQLLASDLSKEPRNSSSSGEEPQVAAGKRGPRRMSEGGQNGGIDGKEGAGNSLPTTRRSSEPSIMHHMSRVIDQFGALPPRRQSEYMKRAAALQVRCGVSEQANDYNVGTSVRNRGKGNTATVEMATQQKAQQQSQQTRRASTSTAGNSNNTSTTNSRRRVSAPPAVPTQTAASSSDEDRDQQRRVPQRKRKTADDVLLEEIDQGRQKLTRHSFSERRSRYEEVKLKREIAVSTTAHQNSTTRRRSSGQRTRFSTAHADVQPASSSDNRESEDSGNDESELPAAAAVESRTSWRVLERQRREQRKESYKLRIEKRRASSASREAHRHTAAAAANTHRTETERPQPVHALIPTFAAHQLASTTEGTRQSRRTSDSRRMPALSAVESLSVAVASRIGKRRRSGQSEQANSDNEVFAPSSRRSGSTALSRAAPPSDRTSPCDLHSLASASVESASEAENSVISGDEELRRRDMVVVSTPLESTVYSTRGKARRDSVVSQVEFMHRSPTHRGRVEPRIGEHYQVTALPECVDITTETMSAVTTTRRSRSANMSNRIDTSSAIWQTASALASTGTSSSEQEAESMAAAERLQEVAEYLQRADALVAELKTEKLKSYFEQQAKVAKQGALLTAQQQRFTGRPSLGIAALGQDESKLPVDSTDATLVVASGEVPVVVHQTLMDCEYDTELALEQLPGLLEPLLTLWTSAEQQSIGAAFERSGMSKKALCGAVAGSKSDAEVWEYTLRFLAAAEELEENTTYTNADGIDCIIPAIQSTAYQYPVQSGALSAYNSSTNLAGEEGVLAEGSKFLERLSASVDEASFWQLLFSLSTLVKSGQCSPAQMVVKAHYILSAATYDAKLSYTHRAEAAQSSKSSPNNSSSSSSNSSEGDVGLPVDDTAMTLSEDPPVVASSNATAVPSRVSAAETVHIAQTDTTADPVPEPQNDAILAVDTSAGTAAGTVTTEKLRDAFHCKEDAISCFNLFLPVLVSQR